VLLGGKRGWRTDDFSVAFLRSSVSASLENERKIPPAVSRCIGSRLRGMADVEFKEDPPEGRRRQGLIACTLGRVRTTLPDRLAREARHGQDPRLASADHA